MGNFRGEDLTGKKFGRLTVIKRDVDASNKHKRSYWLCHCECGKQKVIAGISLKNGSTQSCGCLRNERVFNKLTKNEIGNRYGKLVVIEMDNQRGNRNHIQWICKCDCGNIKSVYGADLRSGNTQSCGCSSGISKGEQKIINILEEHNISYIREFKPAELNNKRFDFAILDKNNNIVRLIEFDGEQHYIESRWERDKLERTQKSDQVKNNYALSNKIPLVRIPYWELSNLDFNLLFSNKFLVQEEK